MLPDSARRHRIPPRDAVDGRSRQPAPAVVSDHGSRDGAVHPQAGIRSYPVGLAGLRGARPSARRTGATGRLPRRPDVRGAGGRHVRAEPSRNRSDADPVDRPARRTGGRSGDRVGRRGKVQRRAAGERRHHARVRLPVRRRVRSAAVQKARHRSGAPFAAARRATSPAGGHPDRAGGRTDVSQPRRPQEERRVPTSSAFWRFSKINSSSMGPSTPKASGWSFRFA